MVVLAYEKVSLPGMGKEKERVFSISSVLPIKYPNKNMSSDSYLCIYTNPFWAEWRPKYRKGTQLSFYEVSNKQIFSLPSGRQIFLKRDTSY